MTPTKTWKVHERLVASIFGTERTPLSGGNSKHTRSDTLHERLFIETKYRKNHTVVTLWKETKKLAEKEGKVPVIALRSKGSKYTHIMVEIADLMAIAKELVMIDERG